jgi:selenocysteine lyase/cysteine desulfurase
VSRRQYDVVERFHIEVVVLPLPLPLAGADAPGATPARVNDAIVHAFDEAMAAPTPKGGRITLALIDHITSPTAIILPIAPIAAAARARGIRVLVDGAHAPGQILPLDVPRLGADW